MTDRIPPRPSTRRSGLRAACLAGLSLTAMMLALSQAAAVDASWTAGDGELFDGTNWTGGTVPDGTGTFDTPGTRNITATVSSGTSLTIGALQFNGGTTTTLTLGSQADSFLAINGAGISRAVGAQLTLNLLDGGTRLLLTNNAILHNAIVNMSGQMGLSNTASITSSVLQFTSSGLLEMSDSSSAGTAAMSVNGGYVAFMGQSTAGGSTINLFNGATLEFRNDSTAGNSVITATSSGRVNFSDGATGGTAFVAINAGGFMDIRSISAMGLVLDQLVANGQVDIGSKNLTVGSLAGDGRIILAGPGDPTPTVTVGSSNMSTVFGGDFLGASLILTKVGTGTLTLTRNNPANTTFNVDAGTLAFGLGAFGTSSSRMNVASGATFSMAGAGVDIRLGTLTGLGNVLLGNRTLTLGYTSPINAVFGGVISGTGGLALAENGTVALTGANTYSGTTTIGHSSASLALQGAGSIAQSDLVNLTAAGASFSIAGTTAGASIRSLAGVAGSSVDLGARTLTITDGWSAYAGAITGSGGLRLTGGSTGLTGTSSYTGATTVDGGNLLVLGSIASSSGVTVNSGAMLFGTGTVGALTVNSGGTVMPGTGGPGTLTVAGNLTLQAGSTAEFRVTPSESAQINVQGSASLAGGARIIPIGVGFSFGTSYSLLQTTGGITGTFDPVMIDGSFGDAITTELIYSPLGVSLMLSGNALAPLLPVATSVNARNVATALDTAATDGADMSPFMGLYMQSPAAMPQALGSLAGETATATQQAAFNSTGTFLNMMLDPMTGARGATAMSASPSLVQMADPPAGPRNVTVDAGWSIWTKAFAQSGATNGDAGFGSADTRHGLFGVAAGADRRLSPNTVVGFAVAGGGTSFGLGQARGSGTGDMFQAGLYGSTRLGEGYASAALAYGWNSFRVTRDVAIGGPAETYDSRVTAHTFGGRLETGWRIGSTAHGLTPYAAVEAIAYSAPAYAETFVAPTTGAFALAYAARSTASIRTELGVRADSRWALSPTTTMLVFGRLAWAYQARPDRLIDAQFLGLANAGFTVFGARPSLHTALASIGAEAQIGRGTRLSSSIDAELGSRHRSIRASLGLRHSW
ncbi:autotransporter outer membrane beta-barrel domain-containing protein [Phreatobacter sp.]|uniref:autotransporter outer membrane beta-barrel domain-containing protein n=1 Tax=Phreatobacter sp. TaxID=1966341 RepID=UPI003F714208